MNSTPKQEISDIEKRHAQRNREYAGESSDSTETHNFSDVFSLVFKQEGEKAVNIFLLKDQRHRKSTVGSAERFYKLLLQC